MLWIAIDCYRSKEKYAQSSNNTRKKMWDVFKVNNKDTKKTSMTSFCCLYC